MNVSVYIFGKLSSGYTQYPDDNKKVIFRSVADSIHSKSVIAIRRDGNVIRYIYIQKISSPEEGEKYLGLALELNDVYCDDLPKLFALFDDALTSMVLNANIVEFEDGGDIVAKATRLYYERNEIDRITNFLSYVVENLPSSSFKKLPPVNFSIGANEGTKLMESASANEVAEALKVYHAVNVYRDGDNSTLDEYSKRLKKLSQNIQSLTSYNSNLAHELSKVKRQKKRTIAVTLLSSLICVGVLTFISVSANLNDRVRSLTSDNKQLTTEIKEQSGTIDNQRATIQLYSKENQELNNKLDFINSEIELCKLQVLNLKDSVTSLTKELEVRSKQLSLKGDELLKASQRLTDMENERDNYRKWYTEKEKEVTSLRNEIKLLNTKIIECETKGRRRR